MVYKLMYGLDSDAVVQLNQKCCFMSEAPAALVKFCVLCNSWGRKLSRVNEGTVG